MKSNRLKIGLVFLGRKRPGFDMNWGAGIEEQVRQTIGRQDWDVVQPNVKVVDDASLRTAITACWQADVDAVVLLQTTMSDGRLASTLAQVWPDPPVFWATPEKPDGDMISSCSLVGTHLWTTVFRHLGRGSEVVYGHPADQATELRLIEAVRLAALVRRLRTMRMALVGAAAPGFVTMQGDLFTMQQRLGLQLQMHTLVEFADIVKAIDDRAIADDVDRCKQLRLEHKDTSDDDLPLASRLYLAMRYYFDTENYDALAIRCWPEMPNMFDQWPYVGLARLADEGLAVACEGDVDGALSAWMGEFLGMGHCYITDWLEHDATTLTLWHGGMAPMSLSPSPGQPGAPRVARHFNSKKPAVLDAELTADMPVTLWRLWRFDGKYRLTAREGRTLQPRRPLMGTNALVELESCDPQAWFEDVCYHGMPHHLSVHVGHHAAKLWRMSRLLNMDVV